MQGFAPLLVSVAVESEDVNGWKRRKARAVNIGSVVLRRSVPWQGICTSFLVSTTYNTNKGTLFSLNDTLRLELRPLSIELPHIVPGGVQTHFHANAKG
ncbi:uncharacterized protein BCR38DRAFT_18100 [Pseudomassariella vexata]|uniref:Uncharacterized protein n=1 Tax=Pseudomassariella vexata TaxID=1141098 RepID=A0A1Y2ELG1_9PEZI|nr:uncharacterized protein BCR38DRAFT_18100 [Pseudomassariella vexata]ORY71695.1 hypothetical protein BCR38DRAFT_18100 [Pseudomassariella vexata]